MCVCVCAYVRVCVCACACAFTHVLFVPLCDLLVELYQTVSHILFLICRVSVFEDFRDPLQPRLPRLEGQATSQVRGLSGVLYF